MNPKLTMLKSILCVAALSGGTIAAWADGVTVPAIIADTKVTGYVAGSYFGRFQSGDITGGSQFAGRDSEFMLNQFKLALDKPVDANPTNWAAGYTAHVIFGQDAKYFTFAGLKMGDYGWVEKAAVLINAPVGNGLLIQAGRMVTLMGVEVVEPTLNPNWSLGNQFVFVEPTTHLGAHFTYKFSDKVTGDLAIFNGWDNVEDLNSSPSYMGKVTLTLSDKTTLALLGYGGTEQAGNTSDYRVGAEAILTQKLGDKLTAYVQLDYGHEDFSRLTGDPNAEWYAGGLWLVYQAHEKVGLSLRADYLRDVDSSRVGGGVPTSGINTELTSVTASVNWTPVANLQVRPEIRYDHSSNGATLGRKDQVIAGVGVAYLY